MLLPVRTLCLPLLAALAACGSRAGEPDPAVLDETLNNIIAADEAARAQLVEEARQREEQRVREMEARRVGVAGNEAGNAALNAQ